jgi:hypothetical protein
MFALICLLLGMVFLTCAYGAWEYMVKGYWVWAVVGTAFLVTYALQINS